MVAYDQMLANSCIYAIFQVYPCALPARNISVVFTKKTLIKVNFQSKERGHIDH